MSWRSLVRVEFKSRPNSQPSVARTKSRLESGVCVGWDLGIVLYPRAGAYTGCVGHAAAAFSVLGSCSGSHGPAESEHYAPGPAEAGHYVRGVRLQASEPRTPNPERE